MTMRRASLRLCSASLSQAGRELPVLRMHVRQQVQPTGRRTGPGFGPFLSEGLVRAFPQGIARIERDEGLHDALARGTWPSGRPGGGTRDLALQEFQDRFGAQGIARAIEAPGMDLAFRAFMLELTRALEAAGVRFIRTRPSACHRARCRAPG